MKSGGEMRAVSAINALSLETMCKSVSAAENVRAVNHFVSPDVVLSDSL